MTEKYIIRLLEKEDYHKSYLDLLSQLTTVGIISDKEFSKRLDEITPNYFCIVIEDIEKNIIIGTSTLLIELKFVHQCGKVAHIEDVVVHSSYRNQNLGKKLIEECIKIARENNCYKIILDCSEQNISFYEKCGFVQKEIQMRYNL